MLMSKAVRFHSTQILPLMPLMLMSQNKHSVAILLLAHGILKMTRAVTFSSNVLIDSFTVNHNKDSERYILIAFH